MAGPRFFPLVLALASANVISIAAALNVRVKEISVDIGADGTDDSVNLEICSAKSLRNCCTTPVLDSGWTNDWSHNDHEVWGREWLGNCSQTDFPAEGPLQVTLYKSGSDDLHVRGLELSLVYNGVERDTELAVGIWDCGGFDVRGGLTNAVKECRVRKRTFVFEKWVRATEHVSDDPDAEYEFDVDVDGVKIKRMKP